MGVDIRIIVPGHAKTCFQYACAKSNDVADQLWHNQRGYGGFDRNPE